MTRPEPRAEAAAAGTRPRILIVDDEQSMREWMRILFQRDGFDVLVAEDGVAAHEIVGGEFVDVVLADIRMPRMDGVELLRRVRATAPDVIVCMMTAHWTRDSVEWQQARGLGAAALFEKPFRDVNLVTLQVRQLIEARQMRHERDVLRHALAGHGFAGLIGQSPAMVEVFRLMETVCRTHSTVLVTGESGTGKELVARGIHDLSLRGNRPFVAVNCGALPEPLLESELFGHVRGAFTGADTAKKGLIEAGEGGTVFLDEIAEMSPTMQVKLLRVLQERTYRRVGGTEEMAADIRVIAATNRDLSRQVAEGRFREDLFYRLNVIPVHLPPLRERREDIPLLVQHFLERHARVAGRPPMTVSPAALERLAAQPWPGNVRELENVLERAVALTEGAVIDVGALPGAGPAGAPGGAGGPGAAGLPEAGFNLEAHLRDIERSHLEQALRQTGGVQVRAAELLGLSFRQFRYLAKKYGLK